MCIIPSISNSEITRKPGFLKGSVSLITETSKWCIDSNISKSIWIDSLFYLIALYCVSKLIIFEQIWSCFYHLHPVSPHSHPRVTNVNCFLLMSLWKSRLLTNHQQPNQGNSVIHIQRVRFSAGANWEALRLSYRCLDPNHLIMQPFINNQLLERSLKVAKGWNPP